MSKMMRITDKTAKDLDSMAKELKKSKKCLMEKAVGNLNREIFLKKTDQEYKRLKQDPAAWELEREELAAWDSTLLDGLDDE